MSDGSLAGFDSMEKILEVSIAAATPEPTQRMGPFPLARHKSLVPGHQFRGFVPSAQLQQGADSLFFAFDPQAYIPAEQLGQVKRVLYGANQGKPVATVDLPKAVHEAAEAKDFDLQAYRFTAAPEQLRAPRDVRVGLIQIAVVKPTTAPFAEQRQVGATTKKCLLGRCTWC